MSGENPQGRKYWIPTAALVWLLLATVIFALGRTEISLRDEERFVADFAVQTLPSEEANTVTLLVTSGTYEYNVVPAASAPVETGTFTDPSESAVAAKLMDEIPDVTEVHIEPQRIFIVYDNDIEAELMLRRAERPVINSVSNARSSISGAVAEDTENTLIFTTTDEALRYERYIPQLLPEGSQERYESREEALAGSELAAFIAEQVTSLEALSIEADRLTLTYREGAREVGVVNSVVDALNDFYPRASLRPNLWVITAAPSADQIIDISSVDTDIPLLLFLLIVAAIEAGLGFYYRDRDDKLLRPLVRMVAVFLFFWSIFGHEPLWDYLLGLIFTTSQQLVHPNATVIEFATQHLELVLVSSLITIPAGLAIGIIVTRPEFRELLPLINNLVNSGQTVPTIAVVAFMAPIIGFGFWPAIIALVAYGLLPVVRNTIAGIAAVDPFMLESGRGMGMTPSQLLFQIELPIASRIIMAGIRTSMVINVGTATLGAFVGSGGLGTPIASGLAMTVDAFILLGAIPAALLAILIDYILGRLQRVLTPQGLL